MSQGVYVVNIIKTVEVRETIFDAKKIKDIDVIYRERAYICLVNRHGREQRRIFGMNGLYEGRKTILAVDVFIIYTYNKEDYGFVINRKDCFIVIIHNIYFYIRN